MGQYQNEMVAAIINEITPRYSVKFVKLAFLEYLKAIKFKLV